MVNPRAAAVMAILLLAGRGFGAAQQPAEAVRPADAADSAKTKDIRRLVAIMSSRQTSEMINAIMKSSIDAANKLHPEVKLSATPFATMITPADLQAISEMMIPAYDRHFTHDEIKEILRFYESPAGRKLVEESPVIVKETMPQLMEWAQKLGARLKDRVDAEIRAKGGGKQEAAPAK